MNSISIEEAQIKILKVLFLGQLLLEANDDLEKTPYFKHKLKNVVKRSSEEIERQIKLQLEKVFNHDNQMCVNLFNHVDEFISKASKLGLDELPLVNKMLDEYLSDPEGWKEKVVVEFNKIDA